MGGIERPELLPDCDVPARRRMPDDAILTSLVRLGDESLGNNWRIAGLRACAIRGGAALAAASFMVQTPGPWHEGLERIMHKAGVNVDRPPYSHAEYTVGLCYVAGAKGLPAGLRHRAADRLVQRSADAGYAEARNLLPQNGWDWLADAVREGWGRWTANFFTHDETAPLTTRVKVALALAEHQQPAGLVPEGVETLVAHRGTASADRLALAVAVMQRAPKDSTRLLCCIASDPLVQPGHRTQAIGLLSEVDPVKAQEMRALQISLPSVRVARDQHRAAVERTEREAATQKERETPEAVLERLDSRIEAIIDDLRGRGSADCLADQLDDHVAENDWDGVAQDIADICGLIRDEHVEFSLRLLEVLTRVRRGDETGPAPDGSELRKPCDENVPRLTRQELEEYAREEAESSWKIWRTVVEEHGWDDDRLGEVDCHVGEVNQDVGRLIVRKAGDHLRDLHQHLVWEVWPALVDAAKGRNYASALGHLATARLLADEAVHAESLWKEAVAEGESYFFDPLALAWPRDFWLVLEEWRRGAAGG